MKRITLIVSLSLLLASHSLLAADLGTLGATFPIKEPDLLQEIHQKLLYWQQTGQLQAAMKRIGQEEKAQIIRPKPVDNLTTTTEHKVWFFNPSIRLSQDVLGAKGEVLAARGTVINPLARVQLKEVLIFFNADDVSQVKWAKQFMMASKLPVKPILVQGDWSLLMEAWKTQVYFDQGGQLTHHFGLTHVPVVVSQEGTQFRIEEEVPPT